MTGGRDPSGGGVRAMDNGRGTFLPGLAEGTGAVQGVCKEKMAYGLRAGHMKTQHGRAAEERWSWTTSATWEEPRTYCMVFPAKGGPLICPVEVCPG